MHGKRPARVASRTHDGRTLSSAAACSTSSSGSSSDRARTGSTATTNSLLGGTSPHDVGAQRRSHLTASFVRSTQVRSSRTNSLHPARVLIIPEKLQEKHAYARV